MNSNTKKEVWQIVLITPKGIFTELFEPLNNKIVDFEQKLIEKYGTFVMQSSTLL